MNTIKVRANQSMADVILQACGSMEAGMAFCELNGVSITDTPAVGTVYEIPVTAGVDNAALQYLDKHKVVIGTLGTSITAAPTLVANPKNICFGGVFGISDVAANVTGTDLLFYTAATGGVGSPNTPLVGPNMGVLGDYDYWVSQTVGGIESVRVHMVVSVKNAPNLDYAGPTTTTHPTTIDLTAVTDVNSSGATITYWTDPACTVALADPAHVAVSGTYYIKAVAAFGCADILIVVLVIS